MEQSYHEQLIEQRRHLHQYPEVGWTEFETTWFITERLQKWGYQVYLGRQIIDKDSIRGRNEDWVKEAIDRARAHRVPEDFLAKTENLTGCVGVLDTGREGPVVALRLTHCLCMKPIILNTFPIRWVLDQSETVLCMRVGMIATHQLG